MLNPKQLKELRDVPAGSRILVMPPGKGEPFKIPYEDFSAAITTNSATAPELSVHTFDATSLETLGTANYELLPAPGAGTYNVIHWDKSYLEFQSAGLGVNLGTVGLIQITDTSGYLWRNYDSNFLADMTQSVLPLDGTPSTYNIDDTTDVVVGSYSGINEAIILRFLAGSTPTDIVSAAAGCTLYAKIYYEVRTFGV